MSIRSLSALALIIITGVALFVFPTTKSYANSYAHSPLQACFKRTGAAYQKCLRENAAVIFRHECFDCTRLAVPRFRPELFDESGNRY